MSENDSILTDDKFKEIFPFEEAREGQREIIESIIKHYKSGKKYVVLNAPTGIGKSAIGYAVSKYFGTAYIMTSQKILQEQYYNDFGIPYVLGKANYKCQINKQLTCDFGDCFGHFKCYNCPFVTDRDKCLTAPYSNINYSFFLSNVPVEGEYDDDEAPTSFSERLPHKTLIVCDESHGLESELLNKSTVVITQDVLEKTGIDDSIEMPDILMPDSAKLKWLTGEVFRRLRKEMQNTDSGLSMLKKTMNTHEIKKVAAKKALMSNIMNNLLVIKEMLGKGQTVVITQDDKSISFKMLFCNKLFSKMIKNYGDKFLLMSATILDYKTYIKNLGISESECAYIECDSKFPIENRIIHFTPVGSMSFKNKAATLPKLVKAVDRILLENPDVKGIIHTVNYDIAERIVNDLVHSPASERLVLPRGANKKAMIKMFQNSDKPLVLISPSLTEGVDLKDDLSRLCIICKVPYGNLKDKWIKTRLDQDQAWYVANACTTLVQMTGRSIRSETDYAKTYILDSDFMTLAQRAVDIFPKWWSDSVVVD